jgi:hypothetical protein
MHQAVYKKFVINEGDMDEGVQALRDAGLFLPVYDSSKTPLLEAPASVLPQEKDADEEDGDEEDEDEELHAYDKAVAPPAAPPSAPPGAAPTAAQAEAAAMAPPSEPQARHRSYHEKHDELLNLMRDTDARAANLPAAGPPPPRFHDHDAEADSVIACVTKPPAKQTAKQTAKTTAKTTAKQTAKPTAAQPAKRARAKPNTSDSESSESSDSSSVESSDEEPEYEALEILGHRSYRRKLQYLVKWAPGPDGQLYDPSWEPKENVGLLLINEYEAKAAAVAPAAATAPVPTATELQAAPAKKPPREKRATRLDAHANLLMQMCAPKPTTQPKDADQTPATAPVVVLPPQAHAMLPATEPLAPPLHMSKVLCREGIHPSIRFGTITGLPSADCVQAELQVSPSTVDDYGTGIFVNNNDEVYVIGQTLCDASTGFYRVATADKCVGFILMEFVQLHD